MAATSATLTPGDGTADGPPRFVVLAPEGADHVRIGTVRAKVRGRLAEISLPRRTMVSEVTVEHCATGA